MKIALDYDGTYSADPKYWRDFIGLSLEHGHDVRIVTHRHEELDNLTGKVPDGVKVIYTDGVAKEWFCKRRGDFWSPDVWIDDRPRGILENGPLTQEQIVEWRESLKKVA